MENAGRGAGEDDFFASRNKILVSLVVTADTSGGVS